MRDAVESVFPQAEVFEASSLKQAHSQLCSNTFNLFLCDLGLPDGNGLKLLMEEQCKQDAMVTVVTTIHDEDEYLFPALRVGIQGYILKDHTVEEIAVMLKQAVAGNPPVSPSIARKLLFFFQQPDHSELKVALTRREEEVLRIVSRGYTVSEAAALMGVTPNTGREYLKSCYRKLEVSSRSEATLAAVRLGLTKA